MKYNFLKFSNVAYWFVVIGLWLIQAFYTSRSFGQIRSEELSESIRNVFWLQNYTIYDGISSNVGWYGTLLILYNIFGFNLFTAKIYRLVLHGFFLITLALLLKKSLGSKKALLPLITIGVSPTLIYFNMLQTSFGVDLQYIVICLYLLINLDFLHDKKVILKQFLLWAIAMVASLSYPSFLAYIPFLWIIYCCKLWRIKKKLTIKKKLLNLMLSLVSFILPLVSFIIYLKDWRLLFYDPHVKSGLFRAGGGVSFPTSLSSLIANIIAGSKQVLTDLFIRPNSYYFEINILRSEFSHKLITIAVLMILFLSLIFIFIKSKYRLSILLSWLLIIFSLVFTNISNWFPGLRRSTGVLVGFYSLYVLVWLNIWQFKWKQWWPVISMVAFSCFLITLHHLKVFPNNYMALNIPSYHAQDVCFNQLHNSPTKLLQKFINQVKTSHRLMTLDAHGLPMDCRLHEIYAAVAGSCIWNHLNCPEIWGYDENTKGFIKLSTKLWETYYFNH